MRRNCIKKQTYNGTCNGAEQQVVKRCVLLSLPHHSFQGSCYCPWWQALEVTSLLSGHPNLPLAVCAVTTYIYSQESRNTEVCGFIYKVPKFYNYRFLSQNVGHINSVNNTRALSYQVKDKGTLQNHDDSQMWGDDSWWTSLWSGQSVVGFLPVFTHQFMLAVAWLRITTVIYINDNKLNNENQNKNINIYMLQEVFYLVLMRMSGLFSLGDVGSRYHLLTKTSRLRVHFCQRKLKQMKQNDNELQTDKEAKNALKRKPFFLFSSYMHIQCNVNEM